MANYFQKKKIGEQLKKNREAVDIDKLEQEIRQMLVLQGFTMAEIAALLFTVMRNMLLYPNHKEILESMGISDKMTVEEVTTIQQLLVKEYSHGLDDA